MKRVLSLFLSLGACIIYLYSCTDQKTPEKKIADTLLQQVSEFVDRCNTLQQAAALPSPNEAELQQLFLKARLAYKQFEWAAEYFDPSATRAVNGAPVQEVELSGVVFEPAGLQVIESFLFPRYDSSKKLQLAEQLRQLVVKCNNYKTHFGGIAIFNWQVFDAAKLEVFRIMTLGITGFDDPLSLDCMRESAAALKSVQSALGWYLDENDIEQVKQKSDAAIAYLNDHTSFNNFDRAGFIVAYANPVTAAITDGEKRLQLHPALYNRLLKQDARTLFDSGAWNVNAYSPDPSAFVTQEKIKLGEKLFADPSLSGNGIRSCLSCHQPGKAFTDGLIKNTDIENHRSLARNTPTLINAALQPAQFYDMRVKTLEDQSRTVVQSAEEMHGSIHLSVAKLWNDPSYREMFSRTFPGSGRTGIDTFEVMNALGSYIRSLVFMNSRFDEYMRGHSDAMNADQVSGFNLFMGKAKCGTCHYMPLFNGNFPPRYVKMETEVIGVPASRDKKEIDSDPGRFAIIPVESFRHSFKVPTVRNVTRTAPYMHNGVFDNLEQVINFYNGGGGTGWGEKIPNQTLPTDSLNLTDKEKQQLIAFMKALDSK